MRNQTNSLYTGAPSRGRRLGPIRATIVALLLGLGALFAQVGRFFSNLGQLCGHEATTRAWAAAIDHMRRGRADSRAPEWERRLLYVGPSIIIGVFSALALLWLLLLLGGGLAWLALNGYGFLPLLGAIVAGVLFGLRRARLNRQLPQQDRLN